MQGEMSHRNGQKEVGGLGKAGFRFVRQPKKQMVYLRESVLTHNKNLLRL